MSWDGSHTVPDPRGNGRMLEAEFTIESWGSSACLSHPGDSPEISLAAALDITGLDVLPDLTPDQADAIEAAVIYGYDFTPNDDYGD